MNHDQLYGATLKHFLDPIQDLLADATITEIMINGPDRIYVEKEGRISLTDRGFSSQQILMAAALNMAEYVGRPLGNQNLAIDGRLPDGSRIHVILPPASRLGICITIRKFRETAFTLEELVAVGSLEAEAAAILHSAITDHSNIIVAGGTGTGKTSLLNALSQSIDASERIVVIEENTELRLVQPHTVYLEAIAPGEGESSGLSVRELFVNALRMRPDRILIGEVRRGEALEMIQAMLSGHAGSLSTLHASSPETAATRLETLCLMNDVQLPVYVARMQVAAAIDLFVQAHRRTADGKREVTQISRLKGLDPQNNYVWEHLYLRQPKKNPGTLSAS